MLLSFLSFSVTGFPEWATIIVGGLVAMFYTAVVSIYILRPENYTKIYILKVHGANMGPTWGRQDPGWPHVDPMNFAIWVVSSGDGMSKRFWFKKIILFFKFQESVIVIQCGKWCKMRINIHDLPDKWSTQRIDKWCVFQGGMKASVWASAFQTLIMAAGVIAVIIKVNMITDK